MSDSGACRGPPIAKICSHVLVLITLETFRSDVRTRPGQYSANKEMYSMGFKPSWKAAAHRRADEVVKRAYP